MNNAVNSSLLRWRAADEGGRDDEADQAFRTVFQGSVSSPAVSPGFRSRTMAAIAAAAERDTRRARRARVAIMSGTVMGGAAAAYFGAGLAVSTFSMVFRGLVHLAIAAVVRGASGFETGTDLWTVLSSLGRGAAALAADPKVTFVILGIQAVAIAALLALQRLLGGDRESFE